MCGLVRLNGWHLKTYFAGSCVVVHQSLVCSGLGADGARAVANPRVASRWDGSRLVADRHCVDKALETILACAVRESCGAVQWVLETAP